MNYRLNGKSGSAISGVCQTIDESENWRILTGSASSRVNGTTIENFLNDNPELELKDFESTYTSYIMNLYPTETGFSISDINSIVSGYIDLLVNTAYQNVLYFVPKGSSVTLTARNFYNNVGADYQNMQFNMYLVGSIKDCDVYASSYVDQNGTTQRQMSFTSTRNVKRLEIQNALVYSAGTTTITIDNNLVNCSTNISEFQLDGSVVDIQLTANENYEFSVAPYVIVDGLQSSFVVNEDKSKADFSFVAESTIQSVSVYASATEKPIEPTTIEVDNHLVNCSSNVQSVTLDDNVVNVELTADNGFEFTDTPYIIINGEESDFVVRENKLKAFFSFIAETSITAISVYASATEKAVESKKAVVVYDLSNVEVTPKVSEYVENTELKLTFTISSKFVFVGTPYVNTNCYSGTYDTIEATKINDYEFEVTLPNAPFNDVIQEPYIEVRVFATAIKQTVTQNKYGLIVLYKPTSDQLTQLSKKRFMKIESGEYKDLAQYITSLKSIPLDVEADSSGNIILGDVDTDINCDVVDDDEILLDLGETTLDGEYLNGLDNKYTEIKVVLPFIGIVDLDSEKVANKKIKVSYRVNLISGKCVAYIYLVGDDTVLLETVSGTIGFDVPYILKGDNIEVYQNNVGESLFNEIPSIAIFQKKKAIAVDGVYRTLFNAQIGTLPKGFIKVSRIIKVDNVNDILQSEMDLIAKELSNGIVV